MSAAAVALVETPRYIETPVLMDSPEERLRDVIHDLRQPLSSIEAIAYYLEMTLPAEQSEARYQMSRLQRLVADASAILDVAAPAARKGCARAASAGF